MSNQSLFLLQWNVLLICNIFIFEDCSHISVRFLFTRASTPYFSNIPMLSSVFVEVWSQTLLSSVAWWVLYLSQVWCRKPGSLSSSWALPILRKVEELLRIFYSLYLYLYLSVCSLLFLREYAVSRIFLQGCSLLVCSSVWVFAVDCSWPDIKSWISYS